jgi:hypothetical protein
VKGGLIEGRVLDAVLDLAALPLDDAGSIVDQLLQRRLYGPKRYGEGRRGSASRRSSPIRCDRPEDQVLEIWSTPRVRNDQQLSRSKHDLPVDARDIGTPLDLFSGSVEEGAKHTVVLGLLVCEPVDRLEELDIRESRGPGEGQGCERSLSPTLGKGV